MKMLPTRDIKHILSFLHRQERRRVQVLSAKIALVCLCAAKLQDKYQYLFTQLADHNNCLSRRKLHALLDSMVAITDYLSESLAFSPDLIPATVDSCFQQVSCGSCLLSPFHRWFLFLLPHTLTVRNLYLKSR